MYWDQLPFEILQRIFYFVDSAYADHPNRQDVFIDLQLVCKSWHKAAYEAFYQEVSLSEEHVRFAALASTQVGSLVKRVTFLFDFPNNKEASTIVQSIIRNCPNIEEIYTASDAGRQLVWTLLVSDDGKIKRLKTLGQEGCNAFDTNVYTDVALKYRDTFTQLYLLNNNANSNVRTNVLHQPLVRHLSKFTALQHLIVNSTFRFSHDRLDQLLNDCPSTLHKLVFEKIRLEADTPLPETIDTMTHAKQLSISQCDIRPISLSYLIRKLKGLQELELDYLYSQASNSWWDQLSAFCLPIQVYEINIKLTDEQIFFQLDKCFDLIQKSVPVRCINNKRELHIYGLKEDDYLGLIDHHVRLTRGSSSQTLVIDPYDFEGVSILDILDLAKQYLPNSIRIDFENIEDMYQTFLARDVDDENTQQFLAADEIKHIMVQHHNVDVNNSWAIVNQVHHLLGQAEPASLHFRNMVMLHTESPDVTPVKKLSLLSFDTSILQHNVLPQLSNVLHRIDRLEITSCAILTDEPHVLKLFLPSTTIRTLSLIVRPLLDNDAYRDRYFKNCFLENLELLKAVSLKGQYTLKIETSEKTYVSRRKESGEALGVSVDITSGTKDNFLIWIKCANLEEFRISSDWNHAFEKVANIDIT